ncbi:MAG: hypothetical protein Q8O30_09910 [Candidatus Omnitrophota bacterium]|nr:hypothetical protein [Candidatus Omnitrophota bacterium]
MEKNKAYQNLLNKMFMIENIGEILYKALISKAKDNNLRLIYERLALNEREIAKSIAEEILTINNSHYIVINETVLKLTKIICSTLTARQLAWILKSVLKRRAYSKWYNRYNDNNQDFWRLLLNHENLQHELLRPFWNS